MAVLPAGLAPWSQQVLDRSLAGSHRIKVTAPRAATKDVTYFRGVPTQISSYAYGDPFGPSTASISFPQITCFDAPGSGDLAWLRAGANVDIDWKDAETGALTRLWEGYIVSFTYSADDNSSSVAVQCKGALFQADNFEAYPEFPDRPYPYEMVIRRGLDPHLHPTLRTHPLKINFPADWSTVVPDPKTEPEYMRPYGVKKGQKWTGLTTRTTGSWNKMLTGQIQSLLSLMYTRDGSQWTVTLNANRHPVLHVRQIKYEADETTMRLTVGQPGVKVEITEDWSQAANVYYGQGQDVGGSAFNNSVISTDGTHTSYTPFAALRQVYPATTANAWHDPAVDRIETHVQFDSGMSPQQCTNVALSQLQRSAHPGWTGNVTIQVDPEVNGATFSRFKIKPGRTLLLYGFRGHHDGLLVHVAEVTVNVEDGTVEMTVDSKFRDLLTISQVRNRARDALTTLRALRVGNFSPIIKDQRKPWDYAAGSGIMPMGAKDLFLNHAQEADDFPWAELTRKYPPRTHPHYYIHIPPPNHSNWNHNWSGLDQSGKAKWATTNQFGIPVLFAETGTIRLSQVVALDAQGRVMPIRFHVSFYWASGINIASMPMVPQNNTGGYLGPQVAKWWNDHRAHGGQHYPFFPGAFESVRADGAPIGAGSLTNKQQTLVIGWGNYFQGAGYYPGLQSEGAKPTGLLLDEQTWDFDTTQAQGHFQLRPDKANPQNKEAGRLYVMIYAEANRDAPVYFLGRFFRSEPGTQ